jgi:transaldolase
MYVEELIAPGVVNTMPEATIHAFADHGETRGDTVTGSYQQAQQALNDLAAIGVEYKDLVDTLEREGVEKFEQSWVELLASVEKQLKSTNGGTARPEDAR